MDGRKGAAAILKRAAALRGPTAASDKG